jgi:hypothetical protein
MPHRKGDEWSFYGAFTDQGLLYHWVKYVKKRVSMIRGHDVQILLPIQTQIKW